MPGHIKVTLRDMVPLSEEGEGEEENKQVEVTQEQEQEIEDGQVEGPQEEEEEEDEEEAESLHSNRLPQQQDSKKRKVVDNNFNTNQQHNFNNNQQHNFNNNNPRNSNNPRNIYTRDRNSHRQHTRDSHTRHGNSRHTRDIYTRHNRKHHYRDDNRNSDQYMKHMSRISEYVTPDNEKELLRKVDHVMARHQDAMRKELHGLLSAVIPRFGNSYTRQL